MNKHKKIELEVRNIESAVNEQITNLSNNANWIVTGMQFIRPLEMRWNPKEDITAYELAKCLPYMVKHREIMPDEINKSEIHFRHFEIIDHNQKKE